MTFSRYRAQWPDGIPKDQKRFAKALKARGFTPIDRSREDDRAVGFVELEAQDSAEFGQGTFLYGEYLLFGFRVDTLKISSSLVRAELERWTRAFEEDKGRAPSRRERADGKTAILQLLRSRAEPRTKVVDVSWNLPTGQVQLWTSSRKLADEVQAAIEQSFEVELRALVPSAMAEELGIDEKSLGPTVELCGPALASAAAMVEEVKNG